MTILVFLAVLVVLILVHELGHFVTAKASKVTVEEFGLGFPPRLMGLKRGETIYSLNAIPLGGFVKMAGEVDPQVPGSLASKSIATRVLVLGSGSLMNAFLPILLFSLALMIPHSVVVGQVSVKAVVPDSPAARAGMMPGETVLEINGQPVHNIGTLQRLTHLNLGREMTILLQDTSQKTREVTVIPWWKPPPGQGAVGIQLEQLSATVVSESLPFWKAIPAGAVQGVETFALFKNEVITWFVRESAPQVAGPVGIAQLTGEVAKAGISPLLEFAGFLSINLAIINIFPLPALDGGRIAFVMLEWLRRGKRVSPRVESVIHMVGFALLMALAVLITYQDILRIIRGDSLIP
ncbi:MAG: M50 family metallopeptidase [Chloroflexota bacterium]